MPFKREYDPDELIQLLREHDGLTTVELAKEMDNAPYETTRSRCETLEKEGRIQHMVYGKAATEEHEWYPAE